MQTLVPLTKNASFGIIFETLFSSLHYFKRVKGERKKNTEKKVRVRVKEKGNFLLWVRWEGMEEVQRFIWRKKGKMSALGGQWAFPMDLIATGPRPRKI